MSAPTISVVIPIYNAGPFLREALDSLLAQTYGDFEAIAVNDGSTDNSLEILQEYAAKDSRIRILDGPNGGYGKAMNRGMDAATGTYMAILEPDDFLPEEAYATLLTKAEQHRLDVVRGSHCSFYAEGGKRTYVYRLPAYKVGEVFRPLDDIPGVLACGPGIWCNLYRLDFLRSHHIRFHESPGASYQDTGFFFLCAMHAERYMLLEDSVYMYRTDNPSSSVKNIDGKWDMLLREYDFVRAHFSEDAEAWLRVSSAFYWSFMDSQRWVFKQLSGNRQRELAERLREYAKRFLQEGRMLSNTKSQMMDIAEKDFELIQEMLLRAQKRAEPRKTQLSFMGLRWYSAILSRDYTVRRVFGIPVQSRRSIPVWSRLAPWLRVANRRKNRYYILGIPVWESRSIPFGSICNEETVPAIVQKSST